MSTQFSSFHNKNVSFCSSTNDVFDSEDEQEKTEGRVPKSTGLPPTADPGVLTSFKSAEEAGATQPELFRPVPVCPAIVQPELDIEVSVVLPAGLQRGLICQQGAHIQKNLLF